MSWNITVQSGSFLIIHFCLIYVMVVDRDLVWSWVPDVIAVACLCRKKQPERRVCINKAGSGGLPDLFSSLNKATLRNWSHKGEVSADLLHLHSPITGHCSGLGDGDAFLARSFWGNWGLLQSSGVQEGKGCEKFSFKLWWFISEKATLRFMSSHTCSCKGWTWENLPTPSWGQVPRPAPLFEL